MENKETLKESVIEELSKKIPPELVGSYIILRKNSG
jgi:hypothetical protein